MTNFHNDVQDLASKLAFPASFVFGTSTASYQIEGGATEGGRGSSIWDTFAHTPGTIIDGTTGDVASDHYHHWQEDIAKMGEAGLKDYRLSLSWTRLFPDGTLASGPNPQGVEFYNRIFDGLVEAGIRPMVTLYHWDLPQALQDAGGWLNPDTVVRFVEYSVAAFELFGDRVTHWVPINEPNVHTLLGHAIGTHAPGLTLGYEALGVGHALNLAHGAAVRALREAGAKSIGTATNHCPVMPSDPNNPMDVQMAGLYHAIYNLFFSDAMLRGAYPEELLALVESEAGSEVAAQMRAEVVGAQAPLDFYGVNYYEPAVVRSRINPDGSPIPEVAPPTEPRKHVDGAGLYDMPAEIPFLIESLPTKERTGFDWAIYPEGLTEIMVDMLARYGQELPPLVVTEGGVSFPDEVVGGAVHDTARIDYLARHLLAVSAACAKGVDVRGYYVWSYLDNWEWADGIGQRFGLVYVDFDDPSRRRLPKDSFHWFSELVRMVKAVAP